MAEQEIKVTVKLTEQELLLVGKEAATEIISATKGFEPRDIIIKSTGINLLVAYVLEKVYSVEKINEQNIDSQLASINEEIRAAVVEQLERQKEINDGIKKILKTF